VAVKAALLALAAVSLVLSACTTLENRRDLYACDPVVYGPYTRMLHEGVTQRTTIIKVQTTSDYKGVVGK
jgi:hypothetical protein